MFSYWVNQRLWGNDPESFHVVNLLIHVLNAGLVFLVLARLLSRAGWMAKRVRWAAAIGSGIFLIHPLQTESVSYVAGRSESLAALFLLLSYVLFLYRRQEAISWLEAFGVVVLFALAVRTKENAVGFAAVLILTDVFWPIPFSTARLRRNWRLYALMAPAALFGVLYVFSVLAAAPSAGFSLQTFTWYQYGFTEARAIFEYIRMALWPVGLSLDHDYPASHTILEHGALVWLLLLGAVIAVAIRFRRSYPLACFGLLFFLLLLAPTSSIVPIADPLVERRMYLPLVGLILIGCEVSRHVRLAPRWTAAAGAAALVLLGFTCYARNLEWSQPEQVLASAAAQSTHNLRPYINLTETLVHEHSCGPAVPYLKRAEQIFPNHYDVDVAWGWALECLGRRQEAMQRLETAARLNPNSRIYEWIGLLYGEMGRPEEAGVALHKAVQLDPGSESAHEALALWYEATRDYQAAEQEHQRSLALDPHDEAARAALLRVQGWEQAGSR
jgi:hypothetical protein